MDRPRSSRYGNPLTFNVTVMFLFYILSISLCLSSFSTCVCVIFNPVGTFRTIANYLFYALGLSILLTFLFVARICIYFDNQASPQSQTIPKVVDGMVPASQEDVDAVPVQKTYREVSAPQGIVNATPSQGEHHEGSATQMVVQTTLMRSPPIPRLTMIGAPPTMPTASVLQQIALEDGSKTLPIDTAMIADGTARFRGEMSDEPEQKENASAAKAANYTDTTETADQDKVTANVITARESRKIEKWISQINLANTHAAEAFSGVLKGDDSNDEDLDEAVPEIMVRRRNDGGPLSETRSASQVSDFQKALRVYMGKGPKYGMRQGRSGVSTPSKGSNEESEFQGLVRKIFMLERVGEGRAGGRRKARST
ncbi:MAG: hypothetical protein Q9175_002699 [Cornicularia normoerica]